MHVGSAFVSSLLDVFMALLSVIEWFVIVWVILSWIVLFAEHSSLPWKYRSFYKTLLQVNNFFHRATRPLLLPFRRILPPHKTGGIDWSPLLLLLLIQFLRLFISRAFSPIL
ncbi:MAG TPA: YggT family protein [Thermoanaerobaculia bacterium]|nr:YggT family protein [Thermoanaerobaculia bacterium]